MSDLISRQDAINEANAWLLDCFKVQKQDRSCGLIRRLEDLPSAQQWIPCSERLPEKNGFYLVSVGSPYKAVRVYEYKPCEGWENENLWKADGTYCFNWFVEAWMPLPQPWKEVEDEQVH